MKTKIISTNHTSNNTKSNLHAMEVIVPNSTRYKGEYTRASGKSAAALPSYKSVRRYQLWYFYHYFVATDNLPHSLLVHLLVNFELGDLCSVQPLELHFVITSSNQKKASQKKRYSKSPREQDKMGSRVMPQGTLYRYVLKPRSEAKKYFGT